MSDIYTCGSCGSHVLVIESGGWPLSWQIKCEWGHIYVPTGAERLVIGAAQEWDK